MLLPHLEGSKKKGKSMRSYAGKRAFRLRDTERAHGIEFEGDRLKYLHDIVDYMNVESSPMFLPVNGKTYCNVYASAICDVMGLYVPRVWWKSSVMDRALKGDPNLEPVYDVTVDELSANSIHDWFIKYGTKAGWTIRVEKDRPSRAAAAEWMREELNAQSTVGIISARRRDKSRSGHITLALPDKTISAKEAKDLGVVLTDASAPLQSQAGVNNRKFYSKDWYLSKTLDYDSVVFAYTNEVPAFNSCFKIPVIDKLICSEDDYD